MTIPDPKERPFLEVPEAGQIIGLGRSAAYDAARRGEIPTIQFGRRLLVPTAAIRRMAQLDVDATEDAARTLAGSGGALLIEARGGGPDAVQG